MHVAEQIYGMNRCDIFACVALKMARAVLGTTSPCWRRRGRWYTSLAKPPQTPPLNGRPQHLIEAAPIHLIEAANRGRLDQMLFFGAADDTGAADDRRRPADDRPPAGRPAGRGFPSNGLLGSDF